MQNISCKCCFTVNLPELGLSLFDLTACQKKRLSIATSLSDRSDADSMDGTCSSLPHTPPSSHATQDSPPITFRKGLSMEERSSTLISNGSTEERVIVVKVSVSLLAIACL
ncbi:hypothetical protein PR048_029389 [Dryococelus australis]|uniref:Uncharacterized protein n=1 Tax=Dryococelus australis TaxID=614101 RepID=A0ABQ9GD93_9NEOP|nr:hypothetical protein PR048_029389 [Dryococelus australis]